MRSSNKVKTEFERKFSNTPVGSRLILGTPTKTTKNKFPVHGMLPPQTRFTGFKRYPTAYNGFMLMGQPRQHRFDNLVLNNYFKEVSGLVERGGSTPLLLQGQEEQPVSREMIFRQQFPELQLPTTATATARMADEYSEDFEDATAPGPQDLDDLSTLTPSAAYTREFDEPPDPPQGYMMEDSDDAATVEVPGGMDDTSPRLQPRGLGTRQFAATGGRTIGY